MLKTDLYSAIKSEDSEALDSGTSQLGSQRGFRNTCRNVLRRFLKTVNGVVLVMSAGKRFHRVGAATLKARLP